MFQLEQMSLLSLKYLAQLADLGANRQRNADVFPTMKVRDYAPGTDNGSLIELSVLCDSWRMDGVAQFAHFGYSYLS